VLLFVSLGTLLSMKRAGRVAMGLVANSGLRRRGECRGETWGDEETAGITAIDSVDLPKAMRIVDFITSNDTLPKLSYDRQSLAQHMPTPGCSYAALFAAEQQVGEKTGHRAPRQRKNGVCIGVT